MSNKFLLSRAVFRFAFVFVSVPPSRSRHLNIFICFSLIFLPYRRFPACSIQIYFRLTQSRVSMARKKRNSSSADIIVIDFLLREESASWHFLENENKLTSKLHLGEVGSDIDGSRTQFFQFFIQ